MNSRTQKIINGIIVIPFILLGAALVVAVVYFLFCEANKAYWDHKVRQWCEKDGGVTVYEKVELSQEESKLLGGFNDYVRIPIEKYAKSFDLYISKSKEKKIHDINPYVFRNEMEVYIRSDRRLLGRSITYVRVGGDFPTGIIHESSFSCGDIENFNTNITKSIFSVKG